MTPVDSLERIKASPISNTTAAKAATEHSMADAAGKSVSTFWHGASLTPLDLACLLSFVHHGFKVTIYAYGPLKGLPADIAVADAGEIVDRKYLDGFVVQGKPSLQHFSDYFRYRMFERTGSTWIDTDLVCLSDFSVPTSGNLFAYETATSVNNAIMRIDPAEPGLKPLIAETESFAFGSGMEWGATGPILVSRSFGKDAFADAHPSCVFYPIPWETWWKPFLPSARAEAEALCKGARTLHLWNNIVEKSGYWKAIAPPEGSFLHEVFRRQGTLDLFEATYPERVVEHLTQNYLNSQTADHMTVRQLVGITIPRALAGMRKRLKQD
ncbi:hypothetical protein [Mongoliimonas terrestris]|uniref:hypothetical protein n=1 Tax=Mongoliimonas terrestris TaxID=1709001 RepID=UPI0009F93D30|nr:hypothetical protein [Mongoliimonas terrestris]